MACAGPAIDERPARADSIVEAPGATGAGFRDPMRAIDGVQGGGRTQQSLDVFSLGLRAGEDDYVVLGFRGRRVTDGPGADLVVFENPFEHPGGVFIDPIVVSVSRDGSTWIDMPHDYRAPDERVYSADPALWQGFAGLRPVLLNEQGNPVDPFDAEAAGGDPIDLASLGDDPESEAIRMEGVRFVRLSSAATQTNADTQDVFPRDPISDGPDIDGLYGRYFVGDSQP